MLKPQGTRASQGPAASVLTSPSLPAPAGELVLRKDQSFRQGKQAGFTASLLGFLRCCWPLVEGRLGHTATPQLCCPACGDIPPGCFSAEHVAVPVEGCTLLEST